MTKKWILITCLLLGSVPPLAQAPVAHAAETLYDGTAAAEQQKALTAVNRLRAGMGLGEVRLNAALSKAAAGHARYADRHYTVKTAGDLSAETKGTALFTQASPQERAAAAGYGSAAGELMETVYMKERAYNMFDMTSEMNELSLVHNRREVMLHPAVTEIGIARVGKATVILGAAVPGKDAQKPPAVSVYPYNGMTGTWPGYFGGRPDAGKLVQSGEGMDLTVYSSRKDAAGMKASLTTRAGSRTVSIPLSVKKLDSGYGYVLTAQRLLRGAREYTAEVSFESGGETLTKRWSFSTSDFQYEINLDDMPLTSAPPLRITNGSSEVPMRYLFELFGARVEWDKASRTITAVSGEVSLRMTVDSRTAVLNGRTVTLDSPPHLYGYTTYVPLRFVSEALGYEVEYNPANRSVEIWTGLLDQAPRVYE